ncbi:MAG: hypothetical protein KDA41_05280, partial [Planctomycetales bacterium]|nr:hypothetical protein [Planctomycetales bacterium]
AGGSINHTLRTAETSATARSELDALLAQLDIPASQRSAMLGERAMGVTTFEQLRSGKISTEELGTSGGGWFFGNWLGRAYLNDDESKYLELMDANINALDLPPKQREAKLQPLEDSLNNAGFRHMLTRLLVPALQSVGKASDRESARIRVLRVLLAAEGTTAPDINKLDLPPEVTADPYVANMQLQLNGSGDDIVVYSVGANGIDDGGKFDQADGQPLDIGYGPLLEPAIVEGENPEPSQ